VANEVRRKYGTPICFCVSASLSPADPATDMRPEGSSPTNLALTGNALASAAGRQSIKGDLWGGLTTAPTGFILYGVVDFTGETPSATGRFDYYLAPSVHSTQANGNIAGNSGADAAAPDGALGSITLAEFLRQCVFIGSLPTHDGASVQNGTVTLEGFALPHYGQLILVNNSGDALENDDVENHQVLIPFVDEVQ